MATFIRVDDIKDLHWLETLIENSLKLNPNNPVLINSYTHLSNWKKYLANPVGQKEVIAEAGLEEAKSILSEKALEKLKAKTEPRPKKPGRPPSAKTLAKKAAKAKADKKKEIESDPYRCSSHPTYGGRYKPRTDCSSCWEIFKIFHPLDYPKVRANFERTLNKSK